MSTSERRPTRRLLPALTLALGAAACAPRGAAPPSTPERPSTEEERPGEAEPRAELPAPRLGVDEIAGPPPASCATAPSTSGGERAACPDFRERLATAVALEGGPRDAAFAELESCTDAPDGWIRALWAELVEPGCADALAGPWLDAHDSHTPGSDTLLALGLAARLERLARTPPPVPARHDKATLQSYFETSLFPWIESQARAIQEASSRGAALRGYERGVVAVAAGLADMRFVEIARAVPIPTEMAGDRELSDVYYASLDEALEPRKARGRDAALVGLLELARVGVQNDRRVHEARKLIGRVFGGSRMTALDALLLPPLPPLEPTSPEARIAASIPAPYTSTLLGAIDWTPVWVRAALERGLPVSLARQLESAPDVASRYLYARARLTSGLVFFRREDFQSADVEFGRLEQLSELPPELRADVTLCRAIAVALSAGPANSVELLARGPRFADTLGNLALLDALARGSGVTAGRAGFAAAYLRELVAEPSNASQWRDLASRYQRAATSLQGKEREAAKERGAAAQATARAVEAPGGAARR